jgi:hypothetical protein
LHVRLIDPADPVTTDDDPLALPSINVDLVRDGAASRRSMQVPCFIPAGAGENSTRQLLQRSASCVGCSSLAMLKRMSKSGEIIMWLCRSVRRRGRWADISHWTEAGEPGSAGQVKDPAYTRTRNALEGIHGHIV